MEAQLYQTIPLTYSRIQDGDEVTGLAVTVKVVNASTGATLLTTSAMTEVTPGQYIFSWINSVTGPTHCKAIYIDSGQKYVEYFDIQDDVDEIEHAGGKTA